MNAITATDVIIMSPASQPLIAQEFVVAYCGMQPPSSPRASAAGNDAEAWAQVRALLELALELPPDRRAAFLDETCLGNVPLRAELESLLAASDQPALLDRPVDTGDLTQTESEPLIAADSGAIQPPKTLGHYRLESKIGEGGMGAVYRAVDQNLNRTVAIKVLLPGSVGETDRKRFTREAKAASALNHPNVVTIYEFNSDAGLDYIVMEFVEGKTVQQLMREHAPLTELLGYVHHAALALTRAHQAGIVHRDLKPNNIMVSREGATKVVDFGLAKLAPALEDHPDFDATKTDALTRSGAVLGTPSYMSPEQALAEATDARSDIFSVGVILYEMVCGIRPFQAKTVQATLVQIATQAPVPPSRLNPKASPELTGLIERCLRKSPQDRPQTMAEVAHQLERLLAAKPAAVPHSRRRWLVAAAGIAAFAAVLMFNRKPLTTVMAPAVVDSPVVLHYSIETQRVLNGTPDGAPYLASVSDVFHGGWKFRIGAKSPRGGHLYLVNDGPDPDGTRRLWVLYPNAKGGGQALTANSTVQTTWLVFDPTPGTERLWVIWSPTPVMDFDKPAHDSSRGKITDATAEQHLRELLMSLGAVAPQNARDLSYVLRAGQQFSSVAGALLELKHQ